MHGQRTDRHRSSDAIVVGRATGARATAPCHVRRDVDPNRYLPPGPGEDIDALHPSHRYHRASLPTTNPCHAWHGRGCGWLWKLHGHTCDVVGLGWNCFGSHHMRLQQAWEATKEVHEETANGVRRCKCRACSVREHAHVSDTVVSLGGCLSHVFSHPSRQGSRSTAPITCISCCKWSFFCKEMDLESFGSMGKAHCVFPRTKCICQGGYRQDQLRGSNKKRVTKPS